MENIVSMRINLLAGYQIYNVVHRTSSVTYVPVQNNYFKLIYVNK
jgi:hypothetical protein